MQQIWGALGMNSSTGNVPYGSCLLKRNQFNALKVGDKLDHRDYAGIFALAEVVKKSGIKVKIHYVGYSNQYDVVVEYKQETCNDFAVAESISKRPANGPLRGYSKGNHVAYRPHRDCEWQEAVISFVSAKSPGQVCVALNGKDSQRYVHLDNEFEIDTCERLRTQKTNGYRHDNSVSNSNSRKYNQHNKRGNNMYNNRHDGHRQHSHTHNRNSYNQNRYQTQRQAQVQRQDQMTVRTQLLLDDTHKQLQLTRNYLEAAAKAKCSREELSMYNRKVVLGLTCFSMKVDGMRKNAKSEGISFDDAFKSSSMVIKKFEKEFLAQFGGNQFLMQRLEPCLNYMRAVLKGDVNVPPLPYVNEYEFNANVASSVISSVAHAQNHVLPDRMKDISANNEQYKARQKELSQQYEAEQKDEEENGGARKTKKIDYRHLIQDFNTNNIAFAESKAKQQQRIQQERNAYKYQQPNLMDGDGQQCDHDMDTLPSRNQDEKPDVDMYSKH